MAEIRICLMSDMCAGNGESVGYGIDSDICTDQYGFPYIPGRRILGCLRDAAECLQQYGLKEANADRIDAIFGDAKGRRGLLCIDNAYLPGIESMHSYLLGLKAEPNKDYLLRQSTSDKIIRLYSSVRGQTKIGDDGKASDGSLRFVRVLNHYDPITGEPLEFVCSADISCLDDEQKKLLENSCKALRHMGSGRNRGLGNVRMNLVDDKEKYNENGGNNDKEDRQIENLKDKKLVQISYQVEFESPVTIQEYMENGSQIKARTVIGAFSNEYLKAHDANDEIFKNLFLDGSVRWSALTPVINDMVSVPAPAMLLKLKNDNGTLINSFACEDQTWKRKKPKSLEGYYASLDEEHGTYYVAQPETEMHYHNRIRVADSEGDQKGLYMQDSFLRGMRFGGSVIVPTDLADVVEKLLAVGCIRLGRSKKVQYGLVMVKGVIRCPYTTGEIQIKEEEPVFAILKSDLVLHTGARTSIRNDIVRKTISEITGLADKIPDGFSDRCRYHVLSGYHTMWQMQKQKVQAVMGGSIYCFSGEEGTCPATITIGEYQQEGLGVIEIVPLNKLRQINHVEKGSLSVKELIKDKVIQKKLKDCLLFEAAMAEMREYAFLFEKGERPEVAQKKQRETWQEEIPVGRLRQMLSDAETIADLWRMVEQMKTSDVSSESKGKQQVSKELLESFYGEQRDKINLDRIIKDKELLVELRANADVTAKIENNWKEPLFTFLHMAHYRKGSR